ncbi:MAG: dihydropteroate synthase [Candidatus Cloacimonetes bacterium]|nr:dihydropteroate synthase [Candidatus Cloacimonadota bacterium]
MDRILSIKTTKQAKVFLKSINVSSQGVNAMVPKMFQEVILLKNISIGAANILKQEMLIIGADAAMSHGIVEGEISNSDIILIGERSKFKKLKNRLKNYQKFEFPSILKRIIKLVETFQSEYEFEIELSGKKLILKPTLLMGILNITPDSFSDGGDFLKVEDAVKQVEKMISEGVDIIDIGGESTRPGAQEIGVEDEIRRIIPVIEAIRKKFQIPISIDTTKAIVAEKAIQIGANIINDISALSFDERMVGVLQKNERIPVILMHMKGTPQSMQKEPFYDDVIQEICDFFDERIKFCIESGIEKERIIIDPGIGFGKRQEDNLKILQRLKEFHSLGVPVLLGASRKSFINKIYESQPFERLSGSLATTALSFENNIQVVRVHDVKPHKQLIKTLKAIKEI